MANDRDRQARLCLGPRSSYQKPELYCRGHTGTGRFAGDVISVNNNNINMFTAGVNYKFGGWGY